MAPRRPALFLDRDGVINEDRGYVHRVADFRFIDGIFDLCRAASGQGFALVVVTNQSGIGRGLFTEDEFAALTRWMGGEFAARAAPLDAVYHCPDHPEHGIGPYRRCSGRRKPGPGMILEAVRDLGLDPAASLLVGDQQRDMQAGLAAGVGCRILVAAEAGEAGAETLRLPSVRAVADWFAAGMGADGAGWVNS